MERKSKTWFITGISRGFGKAIAEEVLSRGDRVIGTTRDGGADLEANSGSLDVLKLDVRDRQAAFATVAAAHAIHGRLDVVVNNAGFGLLGAIEESSAEEVAEIFAVNFFGVLHVTQAALPFLRAQKSGRIVNITSIAGLAPFAGSGIYAASKFAVEGMSQSLAQELQPLGIQVILVEPGAFRTDFLADSSLRYAGTTIDAYQATSGAVVERLRKMAGSQLGDPVLGARAILQAVDSPTPPLHLVLGSDALDRTRAQVDALAKDLNQWKQVSLSTDFRPAGKTMEARPAR